MFASVFKYFHAHYEEFGFFPLYSKQFYLWIFTVFTVYIVFIVTNVIN